MGDCLKHRTGRIVAGPEDTEEQFPGQRRTKPGAANVRTLPKKLELQAQPPAERFSGPASILRGFPAAGLEHPH